MKTQPQIFQIFGNKWLQIRNAVWSERGVEGYFFSHEASCDGEKVAVMPFRRGVSGTEYMVRNEVTPCWGWESQFSSLTGGVEKGNPVATAVMEIKEEAGYDVDPGELIDLGTCWGTKSTDTTYYLYGADVTGLEQGEAAGDGSTLDAEGTVAFKSYPVAVSKDPIVAKLYCELQRKGY